MKFTNIEWDTDGVSVDDLPEELDVGDDQTIDDAVDYLTDKYGWCIKSMCVEFSHRSPMVILEYRGRNTCDPYRGGELKCPMSRL